MPLFMMECVFKMSNRIQVHLLLNIPSLIKAIGTWNMNSWEIRKTDQINQECMCMDVCLLSAGLASA